MLNFRVYCWSTLSILAMSQLSKLYVRETKSSGRTGRTRVFFSQFVRYVAWRISRWGLTQVCLQYTEQSRIFWKPPRFWRNPRTYCLNLVNLALCFSFVLEIWWLLKKKILCRIGAAPFLLHQVQRFRPKKEIGTQDHRLFSLWFSNWKLWKISEFAQVLNHHISIKFKRIISLDIFL